MRENKANEAGGSTDIDGTISAFGLTRCIDDGEIVAQSDSWVLLKQLPNSGWNRPQSMPTILVARSAYESGLLKKKTTLVASSRLPKNLQAHAAWFDAIRTIGARLDADSQTLLTAPTMAADPYVRRICSLFGIDLVEARLVSQNTLKQQAFPTKQTAAIFILQKDNAPPVDVTLINVAHTVHALSVRHGGNIHQGIAARLAPKQPDPAQPSPIRLLNDSSLTKPKTRNELLELGAIDWLLLPRTIDGDQHCESNPRQLRSNTIVPLESIDQSQYLLHWARRQSNAWPDQNQDTHLDHLIFGSSDDRYLEVMTLCRIIASNRLIGAAHLTRDPAPVVCFSAVSVGELPDRTVFRKHLARWDFVPYGLAIRKTVLQAAGCKEVIYGNNSKWNELPDEQKPWFQLETSSNGKIDWTEEREWRLRGDLDLSKIATDDAFAFVKTTSDAERLSEICRWPIVVLDSVVNDC